MCVPYWLALKAEALHLADRTSEALDAIKEAEVLAERFGERWWCAEMHRLRDVFLTALGTKEPQIDASFSEAIRIAREQKSVSLAKTRGSNLRRISSPKSDSLRRPRVPATSLVTSRTAPKETI